MRGVACCPPNVMRLFASLQHYCVSRDRNGIQIHQFAGMQVDTSLAGAGRVALKVETGYPWNGDLALTILAGGQAPWPLSIRIPGWCESYSVTINGETLEAGWAPTAKGYLTLERAWQVGDRVRLGLEMPAGLVEANPRVDALRGCVAVQRGPLVYCFESHDQPVSADLLDIQIDPGQRISTEWAEDLLGGVVVLTVSGYVQDASAWGQQLYRPLTSPLHPGREPVQLRAIPHYAWGNRRLQAMRVWVPRSDR